MVPGKVFALDLLENEKAYLKFSYPHQEENTLLHLEIENEFGDVEIYGSRSVEFPDKENKDYLYAFSG